MLSLRFDSVVDVVPLTPLAPANGDMVETRTAEAAEVVEAAEDSPLLLLFRRCLELAPSLASLFSSRFGEFVLDRFDGLLL